jgi:hypothetical protein
VADNTEYQEWRAEVDSILIAAIGVDMDSMVGGRMTYDAWEAGDSPERFIRETVVGAVVETWGPEYAEIVLDAVGRRRS